MFIVRIIIVKFIMFFFLWRLNKKITEELIRKGDSSVS